jgi:hypothetical protein
VQVPHATPMQVELPLQSLSLLQDGGFQLAQIPCTSPLQVREVPQSASALQVLAEQLPTTAFWQLYFEPRLLQSAVVQQVCDGPVQVPATSPSQVRMPPQSASLVQSDLVGQLPFTAPVQVAPVP